MGENMNDKITVEREDLDLLDEFFNDHCESLWQIVRVLTDQEIITERISESMGGDISIMENMWVKVYEMASRLIKGQDDEKA